MSTVREGARGVLHWITVPQVAATRSTRAGPQGWFSIYNMTGSTDGGVVVYVQSPQFTIPTYTPITTVTHPSPHR